MLAKLAMNGKKPKPLPKGSGKVRGGNIRRSRLEEDDDEVVEDLCILHFC